LKTGSFEVSPASRAVGFRVTRHKSASPPRMDGAFLPPVNNAQPAGALSRQMGSSSTGGLSKALASSALVRPVIEKVLLPNPTLISLPRDAWDRRGRPRPYKTDRSPQHAIPEAGCWPVSG
jgi:hypothetical protein